MRFFLYFLVGLFLTPTLTAFSQVTQKPILEREISLIVKNESLKSALSKIAKQGSFSFSYPSNLFDEAKIVSVNSINKTVREILLQLIGDKIEYKTRSNYLILSQSKEESKSEEITIAGYVIDSNTGAKLAAVSVFEEKSLQSTVTNNYGYFKIIINNPNQKAELKFIKRHYKYASVIITPSSQKNIAISLDPVDGISIPYDNNEVIPNKFFIPEESAINSFNINDTLYRKYQVSFLPGLGTNYRLSGNVVNDYSFNIFGGYSMGTRKFELAGLFNIDRADVNNCQIAGFINTVGGHTNGLQIAGFFNLNKKSVSGVQVAGFGNLVWDSCNAFQLAGFFNVNKKKSSGVGIAGFVNTNLDSSSGVKIAGFVNTSLKSSEGLMIAGFCNSVIGEMKGTQIAGFVNHATKISGCQIGLINVSDSCDGIPIGFMSFVRSGYHRFEIFGDEIFYTNASLRTGVKSFHNILFAGIQPVKNDTITWTFGYGLGSSISLSKNTLLDFDLTCQQIVKGNDLSYLNLLNKFSPSIEIKLANYFYINTGPVLTAQLSDVDYKGTSEVFLDYKPNIFNKTSFSSDYNLSMWVGWKFGLRFF